MWNSCYKLKVLVLQKVVVRWIYNLTEFGTHLCIVYWYNIRFILNYVFCVFIIQKFLTIRTVSYNT